MSNNTTEFYCPWSCSSNSEMGTHTHYNGSHMNPIQVYTIYIFTSCSYITASLNIVINFSSMPATRLKQWVANKSDTLLCHMAHISDITHAN